MVQLPEECNEKSEAYKAGFKNISEISKQRIRNAGKKVLSEKKAFEHFPIGSNVNLCLAMVAILDFRSANYCHHLASVVCKLFTFQASSPKPLGRLEPN
jgi:hypothetical protein